MKIRQFFILTLFLTISNLFSQNLSDTINKYNDKHKKIGFWQVYLNEYANKVDKKNAFYIGYELYDNVGECVYPFSKHPRPKKYIIKYSGITSQRGNPTPINGILKLLYKNGNPSYEELYQNGRPVLIKAFRWDKNGICSMEEILDYTKMFNNIDGTFYYELFGYDHKLFQHGYYKKSVKGWRVDFEK
jgi:hypothetical protein